MKILLVVYDNGSFLSWFPQGLGYIASVLRDAGHEVRVYSQDVFHWPGEHLKNFLDNEKFDIVGVGAIAGYYQYRKLLEISKAVNASKNRPFYVLGGHGPAPEPEYFLKKTKADVIVRGEGEYTLLEIIDALKKKRTLFSIEGIAFMEEGRCCITQDRPPIRDIDKIPYPAWDLFPMEHHTKLRFVHMADDDICAPVLTGRGCPFKCNFCYRMVKGYRARATKSIVEEISILKKNYNVSYIMFSDELLMISPERAEEISKGIIKSGLKVRWSCNGRLNFAKPDILKLMKKAGCVFVNYGIESMDEKALKAMNKSLTVKEIHKGIENTLSAGISPGFNIIFGNIGENKESLRKGLDFLLKYNDYAQMRTIRPVTPYPGSPLYYHAIKKGLLKDCEDFYERKHINSDLLSVNFTDLSDDEVYSELRKVNSVLIKKYYEKKTEKILTETKKFYCEKDRNFRGFR